MRTMVKLVILAFLGLALQSCATQPTEPASDPTAEAASASGTTISSALVEDLQAGTCNGSLKVTYITCASCPPPMRQTRAQARCEERLDINGNQCSGRTCETCTCQ
jgi:hypothetical protein